MKSIKEKAEEYGKNWYKRKGIPLDRCRGCYAHVLSSYEAGANYVLEEVEHILEDKELDIEETCDRLFALVKQLKK